MVSIWVNPETTIAGFSHISHNIFNNIFDTFPNSVLEGLISLDCNLFLKIRLMVLK